MIEGDDEDATCILDILVFAITPITIFVIIISLIVLWKKCLKNRTYVPVLKSLIAFFERPTVSPGNHYSIVMCQDDWHDEETDQYNKLIAEQNKEKMALDKVRQDLQDLQDQLTSKDASLNSKIKSLQIKLNDLNLTDALLTLKIKSVRTKITELYSKRGIIDNQLGINV